MDFLFYTYLFILGTLFGSFSSVIITRLKEKKGGIITGRSQCPNCHHILGVFDLIPLFSYLFSKGKCRHCSTKISPLYPILELSTGVLFLLTGFFLVDGNIIFAGDLFEISKLLFFLVFAFLTIVYVFYDILYLEIPESILFILIILSLTATSLQMFFPEKVFFGLLPSISLPNSDLFIILGVTIISFGAFYFIMLKGLKEIYDIFILLGIAGIFFILKYVLYIDFEQTALGSALLASYALFVFLFLQILVSRGAWMGGGDLRIALLMGFIAGISQSFYIILLSYIAGSSIGILVLIYQKTRNHIITQKKFSNKLRKILGLKPKQITLDTQMAFGPFLALGIYGMLFFGESFSKLFDIL